MDALAVTAERVAASASRLRKVAVLAEYFRGLPDADLARAVRFLSAGPLALNRDRKFSVGGSTINEALLGVVEWDPYILGICYREVGDLGETISLLLHNRTANRPLSLAEAEQLYMRLYQIRRTAGRVELLGGILRRYRPLTLRYFVKVITGGLRIGLQSRMVEEAVAAATGVPSEQIRQASNRLGDLAAIALAARTGVVDRIAARLFHPMDFMLAKPLEVLASLPDPENWWVEDKYDGIRSQVHFENGEVRIYTRGLEEVTQAFPEIAEACMTLPGAGVLDGEILAWREGRALAFNVLQQRIARKKVAASMRAGIPVSFMGYDLLYRDGAMWIDRPLEERRAALAALLEQRALPLLLSPQWNAPSVDDIDRAFTAARERGNEGLLLKQRLSPYEPGKRSGLWYKVKRPYGTLDVVITAAEQGHGRRATVLSDYTFAVRSGDNFVNVGKAYSGLTDPEIKELTRLLRSAALDRFGRVTLVRPEVVLEVAFDGVQKSPRHKSGYALRFPRILRWRQDKKPEDADDVEQVKALYEASLAAPAAVSS